MRAAPTQKPLIASAETVHLLGDLWPMTPSTQRFRLATFAGDVDSRMISSGLKVTWRWWWASPSSSSAASSSAAVRPSSARGWRTDDSGGDGGAGELDVVVADDRHVVGHRTPSAAAALQQAEREQVVGAERPRWGARAGGQRRRAARRRRARRRRSARRVEHGDHASSARPALATAAGALVTVATWPIAAGRRRSAIRRCPCSSRCVTARLAAQHVVDGDRAAAVAVARRCRRAPAACRARGSSASAVVVAVDRRDQDALDPLLLELGEVRRSRRGRRPLLQRTSDRGRVRHGRLDAAARRRRRTGWRRRA